MRVLIYADVHPKSGYGGIQVYLGALIKALGNLRDGNEEYILLTSRGCEDWLSSLCGSNQRVEIFPQHKAGYGKRALRRLKRYGRSAINRLPLNRSALAAPEKSATEATGAMMISNGFLESFAPALVHFPYQKFIVTSLPSVYNPHDLQHLHLPQFFTPETQVLREVQYPFACRMTTRVAVASEWIASDVIAKYGVPRQKLAVIPWGAATAIHPTPTADDMARVQTDYKLPEKYLFYPAVAWPHKNHIRLIEAIHLLHQRGEKNNLIFTGSRTGLTSTLEQQISASGLAGQVRFLGCVPGTDMRALYRLAAAVVVPTLFEAVSGPISEAWQERVPVGCSDIPQLREQVGDAALLFDPHSPAAIAKVIQRLLSDDLERARLVEAGAVQLAKLSWDATARGYRDLYREIANECGTVNAARSSWCL